MADPGGGWLLTHAWVTQPQGPCHALALAMLWLVLLGYQWDAHGNVNTAQDGE